MSILNKIIIEPLKLLFEMIYMLSYRQIGSAGLSIVFLSFVLNILLMPMYKMADQLQAKENEIQKLMKPDIDFIKKTFSGDEQYMLLQTYYRQHNYKPIYALRNSFSLLLQIPFFIAAYSFLSNLTVIEGLSFGPIRDLTKPDGLLFGLNLLPILMTVINLVSCIIYTKGQPLKNNIQLYLMALLFLVLLYNSPACLSFYYLLNNLFSLIKNILDRLKYKNHIITVLFSSLLLLAIFFIFNSALSIKMKLALILLFIILIILFIFRDKLLEKLDFIENIEINKYTFLLCTIFIFILVGLLIPSSVIVSSPEEFVSKNTHLNPVNYIFNTAMIAFGLFVLWTNIVYLLMNNKTKKILSVLSFSLVFIFLINYLFFNNGLGTMSKLLKYDTYPEFSPIKFVVNVLVIAIVFILAILFIIRNSKLAKNVLIIGIITTLLSSSLNIININNDANIKGSLQMGQKILPLSKDKENVVVILLDRAMGQLFPYLLKEKPELIEQFSGFTYYPNTISFGTCTNIGAPPIYGGYEYIPEEMNRRDKEALVDKHNEALKVLPVIFDENNYDVVVCDPAYAGYKMNPDLSIFNDYPDIKAYNTEGVYNTQKDNLTSLNRNLLCFSITKIVPTILHDLFYDEGNYLSSNIEYDLSEANTYLDWFNVLVNLDNITYFTNNDKGSYISIYNSATHEAVYLDENYELPNEDISKQYNKKTMHIESITGETLDITGSRSKESNQIMHYQINMSSMLELGKWFDYLKENNVYDNTRIIIVADHGRNLGLTKDLYLNNIDLSYFIPLLLIKDFNSKEFTIDDSFMTNGDVPYYAVKDLIDNPINPFTHNPIKDIDKKGVKFNVSGSLDWDTRGNHGNKFKPSIWFTVHDDCLDINNWELSEDSDSLN